MDKENTCQGDLEIQKLISVNLCTSISPTSGLLRNFVVGQIKCGAKPFPLSYTRVADYK